MSNLTTLLEYAKLASHVYDTTGAPPAGWARDRSFGAGSASGFYAATYKKRQDIVLAFRGTDNFGQDTWYGNAGNWVSGYSTQASEALARCAEVAKAEGRKVYLTGHSLGGALVTACVLGAWGWGNDAVAGGATFCAPGVSMLTSVSATWRSLTDYPIANILVRRDLVSNIPGLIAGRNRWIDVEPAELKEGESRSWTDVGSARSLAVKPFSNHGVDQVVTALEGPEQKVGAMTVEQAVGRFRTPMWAYVFG